MPNPISISKLMEHKDTLVLNNICTLKIMENS